MRYFVLTIILFILAIRPAFSQDLSVPDSILTELKSVILVLGVDEDTFNLTLVYPKNQDKSKEYPVFLALAGGDQSREVREYCYAAWFRSHHFDEYFTIIPAAANGENLRDFTPERIDRLFKALQGYRITDDHWIIGGTSNGGVATFNFVSVDPKRFDGVITMPGAFGKNITPTKDWAHLKVVLAYGTHDSPSWLEAQMAADQKLKKYVKKVVVVPLKDQGHILPIGFNIDQVYDAYFGN